MMAAKDIFPTVAEERGKFHIGMNRKMEMALKQELDDVARKTLGEIAFTKELRRAEPVPDNYQVMSKLAPEFVTQKNVTKRKSKPVFHDELRPQTATEQNTAELAKPAGTQLLQGTGEASKLCVIMEGQPVMKKEDPVFGPIERANTMKDQVGPRLHKEHQLPLDVMFTEDAVDAKPAIVNSRGTTQPVTMTHRPQPPPKAKSQSKSHRAMSARSTGSSLYSMDIRLPDGHANIGYDDSMATAGKDGNKSIPSRASSTHTVKSVKELLEEAKQIASPEGARGVSRRRGTLRDTRTDWRGRGGVGSKAAVNRRQPVATKAKGKQSKPEDIKETAERSVDEIIASLREASKEGVMSEADRKIQEIMDRVISRTRNVLGDLAPEAQEATDDGSEGEADQLSDKMGSADGNSVVEADKELSANENTVEAGMLGDEPSAGPASLRDGVEEDDADTVEAYPYKTVVEESETDITHQQKFIDEALERIAEVTSEMTSENAADSSKVIVTDLAQAWEDYLAPDDVCYEDLISVKAKPSQLHAKPTSTVTMATAPVAAGPPGKKADQAPSMSLLGSWVPSSDNKKDGAKNMDPIPEESGGIQKAGGKKPLKSIHHFCTMREDIQVPDHYRGVWRRYHVPSKYDVISKTQPGMVTAAPSTQATSSALGTPLGLGTQGGATSLGVSRGVTPPDSRGSTPRLEREALDRHQAAAAQRIMEAATGADSGDSASTLEALQRQAHKLFDESELTVNGRQVALRSDESFLYWTPAPPKWDVPTKQVQDVLFPDYYGAAMEEEQGLSQVAEDEDDEEDEDYEENGDEDVEETMHRERTLSRRYGSARDLTVLAKAQVEEAERMIPVKVKDLNCQLRFPNERFFEKLANRETVEYKAKREQIEKILSGVLKSILGDQFHGLRTLSFSAGSLVVRFTVQVPEFCPSELADEIQEALVLSAKRGLFGSTTVDENSIVIEDNNYTDPLLKVSHPEFRLSSHPIIPRSAQRSDVTESKPRDEDGFPEKFPQRKRRNSAPGGLDNEEDFLMIYQDFDSTMDEIQKQRRQLKITKGRPKKKESTTPEGAVTASQEGAVTASPEALDVPSHENEPTPREMEDEDVSVTEHRKSHFSIAAMQKKSEQSTPVELALQAGRSYVILPKKNKKGGTTRADLIRREDIERFLARRPRKLNRSTSLPRGQRTIERELRVPMKARDRRPSLSNDLDFGKYKIRKQYSGAEVEREWVRHIWNTWFDQVFPPTPEESEWGDGEERGEDAPQALEDVDKAMEMEREAKRRTSLASTVYSVTAEVEPAIDTLEDGETLQLLEEEVVRLDVVIDSALQPRAFDLCRRGAILRKLGRIQRSLSDLSAALTLEPTMLDALWHRHLVYLLLNKKKEALDDLATVLKLNKTNAAAYRSRAAIYRDLNDVTMAIVNYTAAIKFAPNDDEAYFQRAAMYEERGEALLAMEDYSQTTRINPARTEALFRHAMHYFKNKNWKSAVYDFTELIKIEPTNALARMYRGRAHAQQQQWNKAVEDLSAAIHLDPRNAKVFYYRACLLRKLHPKRALQDYSISLLLDDSEDNIQSYLHRAILYDDIGRHEDAIADFEAVLKLDRDMACAHVNLGLIFMQKLENYHRAIKRFTAAIKADPTYVRSYVCRAEAFTKIHDIKNALLDITRAIHIRPDMHHLYMYRGQLVHRLGNLDLAAYCVRHAAGLNAGLGQSPTQQAIVQCFLKNYDKAIETLEGALRVKPVPSLFLLLGKTQMKAQQWKASVDSFQRALDILLEGASSKESTKKPWQDTQRWPPEAAEIFFLIGSCQMEVRDYLSAHDAFNNAIQVDRKNAEAYYWRGICRMKLKQGKGIQDFNKALALNPGLFQAYLSRAAFYGLKKRYSKAILSCNEAVRLQPTSVRGYLYRGALKYNIKAFTLAIRDLTQAIAIDSTCALAYFNRAVCYQDSGQYDKALQDYGIVLLLGEYLMLKVLINRGLLYFELTDYQNALQDFLLAAKVNGRDKQIHHSLGLAYHKLDRLEEAVQSFTQALSLDPFFLDALIGRGNVFMDFGHEIGQMYARRDYQRALQCDACCLPARVNLAYGLQVAGRFQQAWHQFTAAISINNKFQPALEGRAIINLQMSDTFAALQDINASLKVKATAELLTNRGVIHQFVGDRVNCMRDYQGAIKLDPKYSLAFFNAGNVYFSTRQFSQAEEFYSLAIVHNPKDESALLNRAITKVMLKNAQGALSDFDRAIALSPCAAHMYFNRGNLYTSLLLYDKAEADYTKALSLQPDDPLVYKRRAEVRGKLDRKEEAIADYKYAILVQSQLRER